MVIISLLHPNDLCRGQQRHCNWFCHRWYLFFPHYLLRVLVHWIWMYILCCEMSER